jgi:hypothetical protein
MCPVMAELKRFRDWEISVPGPRTGFNTGCGLDAQDSGTRVARIASRGYPKARTSSTIGLLPHAYFDNVGFLAFDDRCDSP